MVIFKSVTHLFKSGDGIFFSDFLHFYANALVASGGYDTV